MSFRALLFRARPGLLPLQSTLRHTTFRHAPLRPAVRAFSALPAPTQRKTIDALDTFPRRHNGVDAADDLAKMLDLLGVPSLKALVDKVVPASVQSTRPLNLPPALSESELHARVADIASANSILRSFIGQGYAGTLTPAVIQRNIIENPAWYTQYTPYQPEVSQGRLESLLNFQTLITDLTALPISNASLLDEGTAAAEAMAMCLSLKKRPKKSTEAPVFYVDAAVHPQTIACVQTRAEGFGIEVIIGDASTADLASISSRLTGVLLQYPHSDGRIVDYTALATDIHSHGAQVVCAADILSLTLLKPPGEWGADIALGSTQRLGVPLGYGGPHAAYLACLDRFKRSIPGRIIGVSRDADGRQALRLSLQTREQHIRREKAMSNICTAQALLANVAAMYAVYHGPKGLKDIALRIHTLTQVLAHRIREVGGRVRHDHFFDTITIDVPSPKDTLARALALGINLRHLDDTAVSITLDETVTAKDMSLLLSLFGADASLEVPSLSAAIPDALARTTPYLTHPTFNRHHSETDILRYIHLLSSRDLSLVHAMTPLGSCTMKLNATSEMLPITIPAFNALHPFIPAEQAQGYAALLTELESDIAELTGFDAVSLQPNSGAQGEYAGLRAIRAYHASRGQAHRDICIIPVSAHGTNPASATMAGLRVMPVKCLSDDGSLDLTDLDAKLATHGPNIAAIMITYPSTFGVFEDGVSDVCRKIHSVGAQVYMDGANLNAQLGICRPAEIGADVCHLNLHKTFCIPHGGGGPGMGPIGVKSHLTPFLPSNPTTFPADAAAARASDTPIVGPVSSSNYSSASILPISWAYIRMMGPDGLRKATEIALLNANYMRKRLEGAYKILYLNRNGMCAHEFIVDCRAFSQTAGIEVIDIAKRLQDYGFHAPTMSWPVPGALMVEPTESEGLRELDRFCDAMLAIRAEIARIESGDLPREGNMLKRSPHPIATLVDDHVWGEDRPYSRQEAVYPLPYLREKKFWPPVGRVDDAHGDRNLVCSCPPMSDYA